ncbi:uncharacterized protein LOC123548077 [Mercenaria mercenaria]|uniref:uncharacterized protein LOC123548077 n=1 Tax=Mercenaria mercenaria TaxID=6596 RepID=UPI00234EFD59|nr:uncharacterized protein LOC123548077 [Mercenaria mercenaria]
MSDWEPPETKKIHFPSFFDKNGNPKYDDGGLIRANKTAGKEPRGIKKIHIPSFFVKNRSSTKEDDSNENAALENYNRITNIFLVRLGGQEVKNAVTRSFNVTTNEMKNEKKKKKKTKNVIKREPGQKNVDIREEEELETADDSKTRGCFGFIRRWSSKKRRDIDAHKINVDVHGANFHSF